MDRRSFLKRSSIAVSASVVAGAKNASAKSVDKQSRPMKSGHSYWLDGAHPKINLGQSWGQAWPQGHLSASDALTLINESGREVPLQSWPTAYWPDGTVKWTAHAVSFGETLGDSFQIKKGKAAQLKQRVKLKQHRNTITVDTGAAQFEIAKSGPHIISKMYKGKQLVGENARLITLTQNTVDTESEDVQSYSFQSMIKNVVVEQDGPIRATVKIDGMHASDAGREWLPFSIRLYFFAAADSVKITHSFVFDGDDQSDFIRGIGLRFNVIQNDEAYDRHVRFVGSNGGVWAESPKGITGLRRDPGQAVKDAQINGLKTPPLSDWDPRVSERLHWIPEWNDFTLSQLNANGFSIKKRTKKGHAWIDADQGTRASGTAYLGGSSGGILFGMRDFWQLHPVQIDIRDAAKPKSEATIWIWSPDAQPMDVRFYHDGLGQETYEQQLDALNITYEDYEPGFGSAFGVARSTDFVLQVTNSTPGRSEIVDWSEQISAPAQIVSAAADYLKAGVFGSLWSLPDYSSEKAKHIENRLSWQIDFYRNQVEQRHWYGFWNYGDVMHTYDVDRHVWRYDIGGYAWDNSELSPDLWLWYSFLRTGDAATFRLAEAMTRHNRDVDIYHLGRFKGLGTRHNVQHWGCSAKQLRVSTAIYRRFHYFLTADERTGDVMNEVANSEKSLANVDATRKLPNREPVPGDTRIQLGTDWSAVASNWLTAWERTGSAVYRNKLMQAMKAIGDHPQGFFAGTFAIDVETGKLIATQDRGPSISHLSAVFGLVEVNAELIKLIDIPSYEKAWLKYCRLYNASADEQMPELGQPFKMPLRAPHSRLTSYAAWKLKDERLAKRAWAEFSAAQESALKWKGQPGIVQKVFPPDVLNTVEEAPWLSTNDASQWGLAAIQNLALVAEAINK